MATRIFRVRIRTSPNISYFAEILAVASKYDLSPHYFTAKEWGYIDHRDLAVDLSFTTPSEEAAAAAARDINTPARHNIVAYAALISVHSPSASEPTMTLEQLSVELGEIFTYLRKHGEI
jgi:hypothetical protein